MSMLNMLLGSDGKTFKALWSGNSTYTSAGWTIGLETSGSLYRMVQDYNPGTSFDQTGVWQSVDTSGVFSGLSLSGGLYGITGGNKTIQAVMGHPSISYGAVITYDIALKAFSGTSAASYVDGEGQEICYFGTSGGLLRFGYGYVNSSTAAFFGQYISLT